MQQQTFGHKEDNFNISQSVKVYQVLLIYQHLSLSGYQVLLQQSQEAYQVLEFLQMFLTHDVTQPNPTQLNPTGGSTQPMDNSELFTSFSVLRFVLFRAGISVSVGGAHRDGVDTSCRR